MRSSWVCALVLALVLVTSPALAQSSSSSTAGAVESSASSSAGFNQTALEDTANDLEETAEGFQAVIDAFTGAYNTFSKWAGSSATIILYVTIATIAALVLYAGSSCLTAFFKCLPVPFKGCCKRCCEDDTKRRHKAKKAEFTDISYAVVPVTQPQKKLMDDDDSSSGSDDDESDQEEGSPPKKPQKSTSKAANSRVAPI
jgi:hypothetical protein